MKSKAYFEQHHLVLFSDTNAFGNVYFARYFEWQGKIRELMLFEHYPEIIGDMKTGSGFATEFSHCDFKHEAYLFDKILIKIGIASLTRSRIEFWFEFINEKTGVLLATGSQAVIWVNPTHHVSLMPDKLYENTVKYFGLEE